jgi:PIN domain nuclease of toxin-antitoxin system
MVVLDASALLAFLLGESGANSIESVLESGEAMCSTVNWSEVAQKMFAKGKNWDLARRWLLRYSIRIEPVLAEDAEWAARLWQQHHYLSLGDRLCLAVADRIGATSVLTADRAWDGLDGVTLIR